MPDYLVTKPANSNLFKSYCSSRTAPLDHIFDLSAVPKKNLDAEREENVDHSNEFQGKSFSPLLSCVRAFSLATNSLVEYTDTTISLTRHFISHKNCGETHTGTTAAQAKVPPNFTPES